eukprot:515773_1
MSLGLSTFWCLTLLFVGAAGKPSSQHFEGLIADADNLSKAGGSVIPINFDDFQGSLSLSQLAHVLANMQFEANSKSTTRTGHQESETREAIHRTQGVVSHKSDRESNRKLNHEQGSGISMNPQAKANAIPVSDTPANVHHSLNSNSKTFENAGPETTDMSNNPDPRIHSTDGNVVSESSVQTPVKQPQTTAAVSAVDQKLGSSPKKSVDLEEKSQSKSKIHNSQNIGKLKSFLEEIETSSSSLRVHILSHYWWAFALGALLLIIAIIVSGAAARVVKLVRVQRRPSRIPEGHGFVVPMGAEDGRWAPAKDDAEVKYVDDEKKSESRPPPFNLDRALSNASINYVNLSNLDSPRFVEYGQSPELSASYPPAPVGSPLVDFEDWQC